MKYVYTLGGIVAAALLLATTPLMTGAAFAATNEHSGFGTAASYLGSNGEMGCHSSSFDEPRLGIGNVARAFSTTVWGLGALLLSLITSGAPVPGC